MALLDESEFVRIIKETESEEDKLKLANILVEYRENLKYQKFSNYRPYGHPETLCPDGKVWRIHRNDLNEELQWESWSNKPWQLEFHNAGAENQERMSMCANRNGKTESAAAEVAIHMTGVYPEWWEGKRFETPVLVWTGSPTNETSRDIVQKALLGGTSKEQRGTGFIPRELIYGNPKSRQAGVSDVVDTFKVRHVSGGLSECVLKTYEQGWRKWQGTAPQVVWMDEEPEDNEMQGRIYSEALTRLLTSHGIMMVTFTPLLGQTKLVLHYAAGGLGIWLGTATWNDAPHLNKGDRERLASSYPDHEVQARTMGIPMLGEGRIFTVSEDEVRVAPFAIPNYYARICGIDFGIDHPAAAVWIAWDRDTDVIYVYDCYKKPGEQSVYHAEMIKRRGNWIPVSWPHDGANREKGGGQTLMAQYKSHGVRMLGRSARYHNDKAGPQKQWPIIEDILERMKTGRFKVFANLEPWFDEFRSYHTRDGQIVSRRDDVLKATFYAVMMKRFAMVNQQKTRRQSSEPILSMRI
jgi:phage terminase large subunit-like protein